MQSVFSDGATSSSEAVALALALAAVEDKVAEDEFADDVEFAKDDDTDELFQVDTLKEVFAVVGPNGPKNFVLEKAAGCTRTRLTSRW